MGAPTSRTDEAIGLRWGLRGAGQRSGRRKQHFPCYCVYI